MGNSVLMGPRYLYALAVDGYGPALFARVHPRWHTPALAIVVPAAIALVLALSGNRSEEHTSELQSLMRISYAVFCLKKKKPNAHIIILHQTRRNIYHNNELKCKLHT